MKRQLRVLTNSELSCYRACPRKHYHAYVQRRRPHGKSEALEFGTAWHLAMEAWWKCVSSQPELRLATALHSLRNEVHIEPFALVMLEELLVAYTARWGTAGLVPLAVEVQFETNLPYSDIFALGGKIDLICKEGDDDVIMEHKTTSSDIEEGSPYLRKVQTLDTQVSTYMLGARSLGYRPTKCIYDVAKRPNLKPYKATPESSRKYTAKGFLYKGQRDTAEDPEEYRLRLRAELMDNPSKYLARVDIVRLEEEETKHKTDLWEWADLLSTCNAPRNPDSCGMYGRPCEYLSTCEGMSSIDDDTLYQTVESSHMELV